MFFHLFLKSSTEIIIIYTYLFKYYTFNKTKQKIEVHYCIIPTNQYKINIHIMPSPHKFGFFFKNNLDCFVYDDKSFVFC